MLNQVVLVGRLTQDVLLNKEDTIINISIPRYEKNELGVYDTDFIDITLKGNIATNVSNYCKKGDILGIKGKIQSTEGIIKIVAEKVTFLSGESN